MLVELTSWTMASDCSVDLSQCDGTICHHHVTDLSFLFMEKFSSGACVRLRLSYQQNSAVFLLLHKNSNASLHSD